MLRSIVHKFRRTRLKMPFSATSFGYGPCVETHSQCCILLLRIMSTTYPQDDELQISLQAVSNSNGLFSSNKPAAMEPTGPSKRWHESLSDSLINADSPLATHNTGDYHERASLSISQIVTPDQSSRRRSSVREFMEQKQASIFSSMV